ncbi:hypothetical protein SAMN05216264_103308 [Pseudomonas marincola]|nr:hypothetical protein SAMN05216264_103308 [Pseudomonas marincola]
MIDLGSVGIFLPDLCSKQYKVRPQFTDFLDDSIHQLMLEHLLDR